MTVIGITGPTGAGKTTVLNVLAEMGGLILDCDAIYHELTVSCDPMREELVLRFGAGIFDEDGALKRKALGSIVFDDPAALADLNEITHRYVRQTVKQALEQAEADGVCAAAIDAIALLESGLGELCHATVAVIAPDEIRVRRIMAREGIGEEYARLRISAQKPNGYFETHCDHVLCNDGDDPAGIRAKAGKLFEMLIN